MAFKAMTVNTPAEEEAHILAEDDAALYEGLIGVDCVLNRGGKLEATVISNNLVRITDGIVVVGGHVGRIIKGDYEDMEIANGESGQMRNDLIVARFQSGGTGGIDTYSIVVVQGTAGTTASDPELVQEDLYDGGQQRDYPLYRVRLNGLSIDGIDKLFSVMGLLNNKLDKTGNASNVTNKFTAASTRTNLVTGEKLAVSLGKIAKWFSDLGTAAFKTVANNLTTSAAGTAVLDAYQGKLLNEKKQDLLYKATVTADSMDDIVTPGWYWISKEKVPDAPSNYGILVVTKSSAGATIVLQTYYSYYSGKILTRWYNNQWYDWATELLTTGDASNVINTFSSAATRANLATGEKLSVSLGKIKKYFADLGTAAFYPVVSNLTTSEAGKAVLDAYQGKVLDGKRAWKSVGSGTTVNISEVASSAVEYLAVISFKGSNDTTMKIPILIPKAAGSGNYIGGYFFGDPSNPTECYSACMAAKYTAGTSIALLTNWNYTYKAGSSSPSGTLYVYYR